MLALSELAKSWPVGGWILRLFMNLMSRLTGQGSGFDNSNASTNVSGRFRNNGNTSQSLNSEGVQPSFGDAGLDAQGKIVTPTSLDRFDPVPERQQHVDYGQQVADQLITDALWTNNGFDFDFMFQHTPGTFLPPPFGAVAMSAEEDITGF
jgi:hypothetical protein